MHIKRPSNNRWLICATLIFAGTVLAGDSECFSQTQPITATWYVSMAPAITNNIGTPAAKLSPDIEIGKLWQDVFSASLDIGRTNCARVRGKDTAWYLEFRPNLNVFRVGKFVNTFTPGIGYVINASQYMLLEFTTGIEYYMNSGIHFNIYFGQYYYSGLVSNSSVSFVGVSMARFFSPSHPAGIFNSTNKSS